MSRFPTSNAQRYVSICTMVHVYTHNCQRHIAPSDEVTVVHGSQKPKIKRHTVNHGNIIVHNRVIIISVVGFLSPSTFLRVSCVVPVLILLLCAGVSVLPSTQIVWPLHTSGCEPPSMLVPERRSGFFFFLPRVVCFRRRRWNPDNIT